MAEPLIGSNPWMGALFTQAHQQLNRLWKQGCNAEFNLMSFSPGELQDLSAALAETRSQLPPSGELSRGEPDPRPVEIQALELSLLMLQALLDTEEYRRRTEPEYAACCEEWWRARGVTE